MYSISDMDAIFANMFPQAALERCHEIPAVDPIIPMDLGIPQPQFEVLKSGFSSTNFFQMKGRKFQNFPPINKKTVSQLQGGLFAPWSMKNLILPNPSGFWKGAQNAVSFKGPVTQLWVAIGLLGGWWSFRPSWVVLSAPGEGSLLYLWLHCRWFWPGRRPGVFRCLGGQPVHPGEPVDRESTVIHFFYERGQ